MPSVWIPETLDQARQIEAQLADPERQRWLDRQTWHQLWRFVAREDHRRWAHELAAEAAEAMRAAGGWTGTLTGTFCEPLTAEPHAPCSPMQLLALHVVASDDNRERARVVLVVDARGVRWQLD